MQEDLRAVLAADATLTGLVGTRIYPGVRPQGSALPAVVFLMISSLPDYHLGGPSGLESERVQIDCYGATYAAAMEVAAAVKAKLSGFSGDQGSTSFRAIFVEGERDEFDGSTDNVTNIHRVSLDFMVHHRRAS